MIYIEKKIVNYPNQDKKKSNGPCSTAKSKNIKILTDNTGNCLIVVSI